MQLNLLGNVVGDWEARTSRGFDFSSLSDLDITDEGAGLGMVSGATFSDVDGDGWQDLLVAQEWGPIGYFRNESGKLVDQTGGSDW